jgi:hypothetical protein
VVVNPQDATLAAYERGAQQYTERNAHTPSPQVDDLLARVAPGAFVLELAPRHFTYWDEAGLAAALTAAGWTPSRSPSRPTPSRPSGGSP